MKYLAAIILFSGVLSIESAASRDTYLLKGVQLHNVGELQKFANYVMEMMPSSRVSFDECKQEMDKQTAENDPIFKTAVAKCETDFDSSYKELLKEFEQKKIELDTTSGKICSDLEKCEKETNTKLALNCYENLTDQRRSMESLSKEAKASSASLETKQTTLESTKVKCNTVLTDQYMDFTTDVGNAFVDCIKYGEYVKVDIPPYTS